MNVSITFRHVDSSDALKRYSEEKIQKLQKFLRQPMTAKGDAVTGPLETDGGGSHLEWWGAPRGQRGDQ